MWWMIFSPWTGYGNGGNISLLLYVICSVLMVHVSALPDNLKLILVNPMVDILSMVTDSLTSHSCEFYLPHCDQVHDNSQNNRVYCGGANVALANDMIQD